MEGELQKPWKLQWLQDFFDGSLDAQLLISNLLYEKIKHNLCEQYSVYNQWPDPYRDPFTSLAIQIKVVGFLEKIGYR